jgi:hypothetical protein
MFEYSYNNAIITCVVNHDYKLCAIEWWVRIGAKTDLRLDMSDMCSCVCIGIAYLPCLG